jgi:[acyl-carrier-protein] S-malonyltransferase
MADAVPALRRALAEADFAAHHFPVIANVDARPHGPDGDWPALEARQLTSPVRG